MYYKECYCIIINYLFKYPRTNIGWGAGRISGYVVGAYNNIISYT
jgi:hypothetical protein